MVTIINKAIENRTLKKIVLSRPSDKSVIKVTASLFEKKGRLFIQFETRHADGRATHVNTEAAKAASEAGRLFNEGFFQADIITSGGNCTVMRSSSGAVHIKNNIKADTEKEAAVGQHDEKKRYMLDEESAYPFLHLLGISDEKGRIFDKKRAKYRQINRFLELVGDIYDRLPEGRLIVCDLCCGKSYLTFAVYWYLTVKMGRETDMYGVDKKSDVIAYCAGCAEKLGYDRLHFIDGDAYNFSPPARPSLVISLHACDTATDIVLAGAVRQGAEVIMSTPCCHHELNSRIDCAALGFITRHSMLRQKLCDAATDALRSLLLEREGYAVSAIELVDPDETPKNVLIRAVRRGAGISEERRAAIEAEYRAACALLGINNGLALGRLLASDR